MRRVASYSLHTSQASGEARIRALIDSWLQSKGSFDEDPARLTFKDGRLGSIKKRTRKCTDGNLYEVMLIEPIESGSFTTNIAVASGDAQLAINITLGAVSELLAPSRLDIRCPRIVRDILHTGYTWNYKGTHVPIAPIIFQGLEGGERFIQLAWSKSRSLPLISISSIAESPVNPQGLSEIAYDLTGLAVVAEIDEEAAWLITEQKGKEWSCYGGAVRVYWPGLDDASSCFEHPLWTSQRLLQGVDDAAQAVKRIRSQLRRRILSQSAFGITEPAFLQGVRKAVRAEGLRRIKDQLAKGKSFEETAEECYTAACNAEERLDEAYNEIEELRAVVESLQCALAWKGAGENGSEVIQPSPLPPPTTVEESIVQARETLSDVLAFGLDVEKGVATLARNAGPPEKILEYLQALGEFTKAKRLGSLGMTAIKWLEGKGVLGSVESEGTMNNPSERSARTWDYGNGEKRPFELHLKPSEATSPDRCVRIYFDYDEEREMTILGWVGRHP
jgi:hypothetical protein